MKRDFQSRLLDRGYPLEFIESILTDIDFSSRKAVLQTKPKTSKNLLPFVTTYNPASPNLKKMLMKHWQLVTDNPKLATIFPNTPIVAYKKEKSPSRHYPQTGCLFWPDKRGEPKRMTKQGLNNQRIRVPHNNNNNS